MGYWFVQPTGAEECRVYYACDTTLRGWVPSPVYSLLGKTALKQTTTWVNEEVRSQWEVGSRNKEVEVVRTVGSSQQAVGRTRPR